MVQQAAPLIGISCSYVRRRLDKDIIWKHGAETTLSAVIARSGGIPYLLPIVEEYGLDIGSFLGPLDGLLISHERDFLEWHEQMPSAQYLRSVRNQWERRLFSHARDMGIPVLGICQGCQLIADVFGGVVGPVEGHMQGEPEAVPTHTLQLKPGTRLAELFAAEQVLSNSTHLHAVQTVPPGLVANAHAEDGTVEGVEVEDRQQWIVSVQCHPQTLLQPVPVWHRLFQGFVEAARAYRAHHKAHLE